MNPVGRIAMRFLKFFSFLIPIIITTQLLAGEIRRIELTDGSIIYGHIVSVNEGVYAIKSESLGLIQLEESRIRAIRFGSPEDVRGNQDRPYQNLQNAKIQILQQSMMSDPEIMKMIMSLQNDPNFQEVLKDPDILKAVNSGDIDSLLSNPKFIRLLNSPAIQEIGSKITK
jgi:hypothetical protein